MDWVEDRAIRERQLLRNREQLWDHLCTAIEKAVASFNRYYKHNGNVEFSKQYADHAWVRYTFGKPPDRTLHLRLTGDGAVESEVVSTQGATKSILRFTLNNQSEVVLSLDGKTVTHEEASRALLEPVLFEEPAEVKLDVA